MIRHIKNFLSKRNSGNEEFLKKDLHSLKSNVSQSFLNMKQDMEYQKKWIEHLHSSHKQIDNLHSLLHDKHNHHQKVHAKDIENINKWIDHLHLSYKNQELALKDLERNVSVALENYNKYLVDIYRVVVDIKTNYSNNTPISIVNGRQDERLDVKESYELESNNSIYESDSNQFESDRPPLEHYSNVLTRSEKNILAELCNTSHKLSYKDLSMVTGVSPSTIKNHICHIKNKGFPIHEINDKSGVKRYFVQDNIKKVLLSKTM